MKTGLLFTTLVALLIGSLPLSAQQIKQTKSASRPDTPSVVVLPENQRQQVDTVLLKPEKQKRRRRFEVEIVPAPPPGRSRQEILYTDSLGR